MDRLRFSPREIEDFDAVVSSCSLIRSELYNRIGSSVEGSSEVKLRCWELYVSYQEKVNSGAEISVDDICGALSWLSYVSLAETSMASVKEFNRRKDGEN